MTESLHRLPISGPVSGIPGDASATAESADSTLLKGQELFASQLQDAMSRQQADDGSSLPDAMKAKADSLNLQQLQIQNTADPISINSDTTMAATATMMNHADHKADAVIGGVSSGDLHVDLRQIKSGLAVGKGIASASGHTDSAISTPIPNASLVQLNSARDTAQANQVSVPVAASMALDSRSPVTSGAAAIAQQQLLASDHGVPADGERAGGRSGESVRQLQPAMQSGISSDTPLLAAKGIIPDVADQHHAAQKLASLSAPSLASQPESGSARLTDNIALSTALNASPVSARAASEITQQAKLNSLDTVSGNPRQANATTIDAVDPRYSASMLSSAKSAASSTSVPVSLAVANLSSMATEISVAVGAGNEKFNHADSAAQQSARQIPLSATASEPLVKSTDTVSLMAGTVNTDFKQAKAKAAGDVTPLTQLTAQLTTSTAGTINPLTSNTAGAESASQIGVANMFQATSAGIVTAPTQARTDSLASTMLAPYTVSINSDSPDIDLASNIRWMANGNISNAMINLAPSGMGPISIQVTLDGEQMNVAIVAPQGATREALEMVSPRLRENLSAQGLDQVRVDISDGKSDGKSSDTQSHTQTRNQQRGDSSSENSRAGDQTQSMFPPEPRDYQPSRRNLLDAYV